MCRSNTGLSMDVEDFPYRPDFLQSHTSHVIVYHKLVDFSRFKRPPKTQMSKVVFLTQGPWLILAHALGGFPKQRPGARHHPGCHLHSAAINTSQDAVGLVTVRKVTIYCQTESQPLKQPGVGHPRFTWVFRTSVDGLSPVLDWDHWSGLRIWSINSGSPSLMGMDWCNGNVCLPRSMPRGSPPCEAEHCQFTKMIRAERWTVLIDWATPLHLFYHVLGPFWQDAGFSHVWGMYEFLTILDCNGWQEFSYFFPGRVQQPWPI